MDVAQRHFRFVGNYYAETAPHLGRSHDVAWVPGLVAKSVLEFVALALAVTDRLIVQIEVHLRISAFT